MTRKTKIHGIIILLIVYISTGCQKDTLIAENFPFLLEYYVCNENGEKTTNFREGESFYIYFSIENTSDTNFPINNHNLFFNNELFNIYEESGARVVGTPLEKGICYEVMGCQGQAHIKYDISVTYPIENDTTLGFMCCGYNLTKFPVIPIGEYMIKYTGSIPYFILNEDHEVVEYETEDYNLIYKFEIVK